MRLLGLIQDKWDELLMEGNVFSTSVGPQQREDDLKSIQFFWGPKWAKVPRAHVIPSASATVFVLALSLPCELLAKRS